MDAFYLCGDVLNMLKHILYLCICVNGNVIHQGKIHTHPLNPHLLPLPFDLTSLPPSPRSHLLIRSSLRTNPRPPPTAAEY